MFNEPACHRHVCQPLSAFCQVSPPDLGWPVRRPRQICILILKCFLYPTLHGPKLESCIPDELQLGSTLKHIFFKTIGFEFRSFMVATPEEIDATMADLRTRKRAANEDRDGPLGYLSTTERKRQAVYAKLHPQSVVDLQQDPLERPVFSRHGLLHCLIKNMGVAFDNVEGRPWTASELMTAMGMPISAEHQQVTGTMCQFSRGQPSPAARTRRFTTESIGNAMHIAVMGSMTMLCVLKFPLLGTTTRAGTSTSASSAAPPTPSSTIGTSTTSEGQSNDNAPSGFAAAFAHMYKKPRVR